MTQPCSADAILTFWFEEITPKQWWVKDSDFDQMINERFATIHQAAHAGELFSWRESAEGRLAEVIVLDQFSRNIYRDTPASFASDPLALCLAQHAVSLGLDEQLNGQYCQFLYMPYMHSESAAIHRVAEQLFSNPRLPAGLDFELKHKAIIDRFGRYPHRNAILGRTSTAEEVEFLKQPGSSF